MAEARTANPLVDQFRGGGVPKDLRLMAAQGALPLGPTDLVELVHFLLSDRDAAVRETAAATLTGLPSEALLPTFKDRTTLGAVLAWGLKQREERELREALLQNQSTPDAAIEAVVAGLPEHVAELVVINQTRLLRSTSLLVALESNTALSNDQRRRLRELRETFKIGEQPEEPPAEPPPPVQAEEPPEEPAEEEQPAEAPQPINEEEALSRYLTKDEMVEAEKVSAVQRIYRMSAAQKVIAALKGNREERSILIRDPNRLVASAVLGSPRLTEPEVETFAGMRNISDEVLRKIGNHRDWLKRYPVVYGLVKNPRTPLAVALPLVARLNPRDMRGLTTDRNVPEVIRKQAQKFTRGAGGGRH